ncbi:MAG TPA: hypothetical protein VMH80_20860 [Bryobacteraceae bacterium]|nr:hypothetical protein [Bryobacteraceae bacterium]
MKKYVLALLAMTIAPFSALAVDGVVLINQSTVMAAGGFPYFIAAAGSYKLSGNLIVPAGVDGIDVHSPDVTLDLNGFSITATGTSLSTGFGIATAAQNFSLRNGTIRNFSIGVFSTGTGQITDLHATRNGTGFVLATCGLASSMSFANAAIRACSIGGFESSLSGFVIARASANSNHENGFDLADAAVSDSVSSGNSEFGFSVIRSSLIHNVADGNGVLGIQGVLSVFASNIVVNNGEFSLNDLSGGSQKNNFCTGGLC